MEYENAEQLFDAFQSHIGDVNKRRFGQDFIHRSIEVYVNPKSPQKQPCYTKRSGNPYPYSIWNYEEVAQHNQF